MKKLMPLVASIILILVAGIFASAGMMAKFSDTETSKNNKFEAGTLDLEIKGKSKLEIEVKDMKPGDSDSKAIELENKGSIDGKVSIHIMNVVNDEGKNPESETGNTAEPGELGLYLLITIKYDNNDDGDYNDPGEVIVSGQALNTLQCVENLMGTLDAQGKKSKKNCLISWELPIDTGNDVQGDKVTFDIEFYLEQA
jgi:predicted ribosomally synthesized peptide with SipW-like signal peptide